MDRDDQLSASLRLLLRSRCYRHLGHPAFAQSLLEQALFENMDMQQDSNVSVEQNTDDDISRAMITYFAEQIALESNNGIRAARYHKRLSELLLKSSIAKTQFAIMLLSHN